MKTVKLNLKNNDYNICINKGLFKEINKYIKTFFKGKKIIVITDKNIFRLYGSELQKTLEKLNCSVNQIIIEPGEKSKHFSNLENIYKDLIKFKITRICCSTYYHVINRIG